MIQAGQVVLLDGGTTAVQLARQLPRDPARHHRHAQPVDCRRTGAPPSVDAWRWVGACTSTDRVGAATVEAIGRIRADRLRVCPACIRKRHYHRRLRRSVREARHERGVKPHRRAGIAGKVNTASPFQIIPLSQVNDIVVHRDVDDALVAPYREIGINATLV